MSLDKNKPFGVVIGVHDASFEQDGELFDFLGNAIAKDSKPKRKKRDIQEVTEIDTSDADAVIMPEVDTAEADDLI